MKTYTVLFAEDVPHYGTAEIDAPDDEAAIEAAKSFDSSQVTDDPDWSSPVCRRIVHIESPSGEIIAADVPLDNCHLRYGGDEDRRLCDAAPKLLAALQRIAATPLWSEPIADRELRHDYIYSDEYDLKDNGFNPSCDTESTQLRDAVEDARATLALLDGGTGGAA